MFKRVVAVCALVALAAACGDKESPTGPTPNNNNQNQPPANRNPAVNAVQVSPTFGISELTVFNFTATASDPDNDALTYSWNILGGNYPGSTGQLIFTGYGSARATVNVTDGKGGTASGSVDFIVGSMTGHWEVTVGPLAGTSFDLEQGAGGLVSGAFNFPELPQGRTDPAEPGRITAAGVLTMRVKIDRFLDFYVNGTMDNTGRTITGTLKDSGFTGQPIVMVKP